MTVRCVHILYHITRDSLSQTKGGGMSDQIHDHTGNCDCFSDIKEAARKEGYLKALQDVVEKFELLPPIDDSSAEKHQKAITSMKYIHTIPPMSAYLRAAEDACAVLADVCEELKRGMK